MYSPHTGFYSTLTHTYNSVIRKPSKTNWNCARESKVCFALKVMKIKNLTLSWRRPISYRNQSTDLLRKSMDSFLYDIGLRHERVNQNIAFSVSYLIFYKETFLCSLYETICFCSGISSYSHHPKCLSTHTMI